MFIHVYFSSFFFLSSLSVLFYFLVSWILFFLIFLNCKYLIFFMGLRRTGDEVIIRMLECYEGNNHKELLRIAKEELYSRIIPFNTEDIHFFLSNFILILKQTIPEGIDGAEGIDRELAEEILSVIDLIVHPRKGTIIEGKNRIDDLVEKVEEKTEEEKEEKEEEPEETNKRVRIDIVE